MKPLNFYFLEMNSNSPKNEKNKPNPKNKIFLSYGLQFILTIATVALLPQFWDFASTVFESEEARKLDDYKEEIHRVKFMDSIVDVERTKFTERAFLDQKYILEEVKNLARNLNNVHSITIVKAHDGGNPISTSSFKYLTVMYSISTVEGVDILMDYQKRIIASGNNWLVSNTIANDFTYIPNIYTNKNYTGLSRDYCVEVGMQSFITIYIKSLSSSYFLTASFTVTNPGILDSNLFIKVLNTKERLKSLIYETPDRLKTNRYDL